MFLNNSLPTFFLCVQGLLREIHRTLIINLDKWVPNFSGLAIIGANYDPLIRDLVVKNKP
jgi:hypothetical protein